MGWIRLWRLLPIFGSCCNDGDNSLAHGQYSSVTSKSWFTPPCQTRRNCLVCVASASAVWTGFPTTQDCRRRKFWSLNTFKAICLNHTGTPEQTLHRQDCFVASGERCELDTTPWSLESRLKDNREADRPRWLRLADRRSHPGDAPLSEHNRTLRNFSTASRRRFWRSLKWALNMTRLWFRHCRQMLIRPTTDKYESAL